MNQRIQSRATLFLAGGGLLASVGVGLACVGPLLGIALGVGGLGFLTRYHHLQLPATLATAALLAAGFYLAYHRRRGGACAGSARTRLARWSRVALWVATAFAVAINLFEHVVFPRL